MASARRRSKSCTVAQEIAMANKSAKKVNLAKSQAVSLLDTLRASVSDVRDVNLNLDILLENLGIGAGILGENLTSDEVLDAIASKGKMLKRAISAIKQIKKSKSDLEALTRPAVVKHTQEGRGPSLAYAINTQLGINKRRTRKGDILSAKDIEDQFVGPIATPEQIVEGIRRGDARRNREAREKKENRYNYNRLLARRRADERKERSENKYNYMRKQVVERKELFEKAPWIKSLVKAGLIEQKYIPDISKKVSSLSRVPLLGGAAMMMSKHPIMAAIASMLAIASKSASANIELANWEQGPRAFGSVDKKFSRVAKTTGLKTDQIQKEWYSLVSKYGPSALPILSQASLAMRGKGQLERIKIAEAFGLSPQLVNIADAMFGGAKVSRAGNVAKTTTELEQIATASMASKNPIKWLRGLFLSVPGTKELGATADVITERNEEFPALTSGLGNAIWNFLFGSRQKGVAEIEEAFGNVERSQEIAATAERYEAGELGGKETTINNTGDTNITNNITVNGSAEIKDAVSGATEGSLDAVDRQRKLDYISSGVLQ